MPQDKSVSFLRRILYYCIGFIITFIILFLAGEILLRIYYALTKHTNDYVMVIPDEKLGWKTNPNYIYEGIMDDKDRVEYPVHYTTDENGFRLYGNPDSDKLKVFFLGDSYTQSIEVSNDKLFYHYLKDSLDIEVFAHGTLGYGTLQQYMILDQHIDKIQPDILVLQTCSNDFLDNHAPLESVSNYRISVANRRPYYTTKGEVYYFNSQKTWEKIKPYSNLLALIINKWESFNQKIKIEKPAEQLITEQGRNYELYDTSVQITELLFQKIANRLDSSTQLIICDVDHYEPYISEYKRISKDVNATFTNLPAYALITAENNGTTVRAYDGYHWNEKGHQVIAEALQPFFRPLLKSKEVE